MDDPWDVKSVRLAGHYTSCMKINGVPLLPPVLSKECRKEMQYYKLLAKEVEKRISILEPYICSSKESSGNRSKRNSIEISPVISPRGSPPLELQEIVHTPQEQDFTINSSKLVVDFSLHINQTNVCTRNTSPSKPLCLSEDLPERDYNCSKKKEILPKRDTDTSKSHVNRVTNEKSKVKKVNDRVDFSFRFKKDDLFESLSPTDSEGLKSIGSKTFSGSLNDIFTNSIKEQDSQLTRQRSYTLLNPSPQLLAHLEVQSLNTGVEMSKISMSESLSNISYSPNRKRRSWDLESAKMKWSSMAMELKQKNINGNNNKGKTNFSPKANMCGQVRQTSPTRMRSVVNKRANSPQKPAQKSEPIRNTRKPSPLRQIPSNSTIVKEPVATRKREVHSPKSPKSPTSPKSPKSPKHLPIAESDIADLPEDPATRVRELYDKIQKQQLIQMASLVEKQKREQLLLQQVFEEQNALLFKQLKTICPKSPIEAKEAWGENHKAERGPVSLSQLINHTPQKSIMDRPASPNNRNYIDHSNNALKKKSRTVSCSPNGRCKASPNKSQPNGSITRTHSPTDRTHISRRLNYETSASSDRELEPILTDRTNDTMADVNVTFPSDSDNSYSNKSKEPSVIYANSDRQGCPSTDSAIRSMERTIRNSMNSDRRKDRFHHNPTPEQRAAASIIVSHARGYLVRRLFRTERVQTTVQTIKDALLCALQLHQDREGIRGADVDLHRRLIQQITAACYTLHDTFISSTPAERCVMIAADRERRKSLANRPPVKLARPTRDIMSQSHSGAFPARPKRSSTSTVMTQSTHESYNTERTRPRYMPSPRQKRPWR